ncbi:MAG: T9SS type A sorting domain-containing protein [Bacteroidota bacterium]
MIVVLVGGWDWKNFSFQSGWSVEDSMVFFVKAKDETIWKLVLTEFGGSANGNFYLSKTQLTATSTEEDFAPFFNVFPNPMTGHQLNFVVDLPQFEPSAAVSVLDLQGRTVYRETMALQSGMQQYSLALPSLSSGVYVLQIDFGNNQRLHKRIVKR